MSLPAAGGWTWWSSKAPPSPNLCDSVTCWQAFGTVLNTLHSVTSEVCDNDQCVPSPIRSAGTYLKSAWHSGLILICQKLPNLSLVEWETRDPCGNGNCFGLAIDCPLWRRNLCWLGCVIRCPLLIGSVLKRDTRSSWLSWLLGMFVSDTDIKCIWKMWQVHIFSQTQKLIIHKNLLFLLRLWHLKYKYRKCLML